MRGLEGENVWNYSAPPRIYDQVVKYNESYAMSEEFKGMKIINDNKFNAFNLGYLKHQVFEVLYIESSH